jgi:CDP-diacylglycerol--glycerol-3-phosphate 3-phosphatidyltransferase
LTIANYVTLLRIAFIPLIIGLLFARVDGLAVIIFLTLSFSDAVDGYIARRYNQVSDLGKFLDPLADKVLVISVLIVLVALRKVGAIPVVILTARELIVQGIRIDAAQYKKIIAAGPVAKWKTATQVVAVAMLILRLPYVAWVLWLSVALSIISGGAYLWQSRILRRLRSS